MAGENMKKIILLTISILVQHLFFINNVLAEPYTINTFDFPPYVEKKSGLAIDIVKELFKRAGLKYKIKTMPLKRSIKVAKEEKNTCVVPVQRSQERETKFKWVGPIIITQTGLFSLSEDDIKIDVFKDAFQYPILVARGSADEEYLEGFGLKTDVAADGYLNILKLKGKRARLLAGDTIITPYYAEKAGVNIKKQITIITTLRSLACNLNIPDETILLLNDTLSVMYSDGKIRKIFAKYAQKFDIKDSAQFLE
jgi:polar amino acid transport system substrate-binding protein